MPEEIIWHFKNEPSPSANMPWYAAHRNRWKRQMRGNQAAAESSSQVDSGYPDFSSSSSFKPAMDSGSQSSDHGPEKVPSQSSQAQELKDPSADMVEEQKRNT